MPIGLFITGTALAIIVGALAVVFFRDLGRFRILNRTTFDSVSTITEGTRVVVRGTVTSKNTHRTPISEETCAWFSSQAKAARATRNGKQFSTVEDLRSEAPLTVRDATGSISVDPNLSFVAATCTRYYWSSDEPLRFGARRLVFGRSVPLYPKQEGQLVKVEDATPSQRFSAQALYEEQTLAEGDEAIVAGVARHGPHGMLISSEKRGQGVIARVGETRIRDELKTRLITYGIILGIIGTGALNIVLMSLIMLIMRLVS